MRPLRRSTSDTRAGPSSVAGPPCALEGGQEMRPPRRGTSDTRAGPSSVAGPPCALWGQQHPWPLPSRGQWCPSTHAVAITNMPPNAVECPLQTKISPDRKPLDISNNIDRTSLMVQWIRLRLPMQGTWVWSLVREDSTCHGATKPMCHSYWAQPWSWRATATGPMHRTRWSSHAASLCSATREATQWKGHARRPSIAPARCS